MTAPPSPPNKTVPKSHASPPPSLQSLRPLSRQIWIPSASDQRGQSSRRCFPQNRKGLHPRSRRGKRLRQDDPRPCHRSTHRSHRRLRFLPRSCHQHPPRFRPPPLPKKDSDGFSRPLQLPQSSATHRHHSRRTSRNSFSQDVSFRSGNPSSRTLRTCRPRPCPRPPLPPRI